jgi:hypothetical protein
MFCPQINADLRRFSATKNTRSTEKIRPQIMSLRIAQRRGNLTHNARRTISRAQREPHGAAFGRNQRIASHEGTKSTEKSAPEMVVRLRGFAALCENQVFVF